MWFLWTMLACLGFGVGSTMQKHGMAMKLPKLSLAILRQEGFKLILVILKNWIWILGVLINLMGGLCMILALNDGELSIVQPLVNGNVLVAILLGVLVLGERLSAAEWAGAAVLLMGAVLLSLAGTESAAKEASNIMDIAGIAWISGFCLVAVILLLIIGSRKKAGTGPELYFALAAGLLFGLGAVTLKALTVKWNAAPMDFGLPMVMALVLDWPLWGVIVTNVVGFVLYQVAFSHGRVAVISPLTTNASILLPVAAGFAAFGEAAGPIKLIGIVTVVLGTGLLLAKGKQ